MAVRILTDSTSYLNEEIRSQLDIKMVSLNLSFENKNFREIDIENETFFKMMEARGIPTSSQPSVGDIYSEMIQAIENGDSLCCIFLSSEMSGTYSTAVMAKEMATEKYPDARIEILDSRSNCMQLGFPVILAAKAAKEGKSLEQVKETALDNIKKSRFLFIPDNLEYLKKGGRIGGASALIGNLLRIIPILTVENGKTAILKKVRTKKNAIQYMVDIMLHDVDVYGLGDIVVQHINNLDEARSFAKTLEEKLNIKIKIADIGPVIGLHVGPKTLALTYYTKENMR